MRRRFNVSEWKRRSQRPKHSSAIVALLKMKRLLIEPRARPNVGTHNDFTLAGFLGEDYVGSSQKTRNKRLLMACSFFSKLLPLPRLPRSRSVELHRILNFRIREFPV